jgi:nucleotide-binding universal stress UspA family protein
LVVGTDGSDIARAAIETAVELAKELNASITAAYVHGAPSPIFGEPYSKNWLTQELAHGATALAEARELAAEAGVEVHAELLDGDPAEQLLRLAEAEEADLIVIGARRSDGLRADALGGVSRAVIRDADCPVLVVSGETARRPLRVRQRALVQLEEE